MYAARMKGYLLCEVLRHQRRCLDTSNLKTFKFQINSATEFVVEFSGEFIANKFITIVELFR